MIDLILCTKNRSSDFRLFLDKINLSSYKKFKLIVVDQSSDAESSLNKKYLYNYNFDYLYIRDEGSGLSRARNIGIKFSKNKIMAFPDDDCYYPVDLLNYVIKSFENPKLSLISGYFKAEDSPFRTPNIKVKLNYFNVGKYLSSVTFFIRKIDDRNYRFDENIGAGTSMPFGEEINFIYNQIPLMNLAIYDSNIVVFHPEKHRNLPDIVSQYNYGYILGRNLFVPSIFIYTILGFIKILFRSIDIRKNFLSISYRLGGIKKGLFNN
jgi:glycosyltransferase involved in cell wall biosynthesis